MVAVSCFVQGLSSFLFCARVKLMVAVSCFHLELLP
jgi:hypothetical protein